jgi:hypothetical protein
LLWFCLFSFCIIESAAASPLLFPAKPAGLTNCPTISQPEIEQLSPTLAEKLGGPDAANLLVPSIAHLLSQSQRFKLTHGTKAQCRCVVRLTDLALEPANGTTKIKPGQLSQALGGLFKKGSSILSSISDLSTNMNWSDNTEQLSFRCEVSVEIIDTEDGAVLGEDIGEAACTNTAREISLNLLGLAYGNGDKAPPEAAATKSPSSTPVDYKTRFVQLAAYHAICNLIPSLDPKLLELANARSSEKEIIEDSHPASPRFCPNCGKATGGDDKFCTHCGKPLPKG